MGQAGFLESPSLLITRRANRSMRFAPKRAGCVRSVYAALRCMPIHELNAMILAAGLGTRLGGLGQERPKAMLPVCNQPLVSWALGWAAHHGLRRAAVNLHHHGEQIRTWVSDGRHLGVEVVYSEEPELLGTGGGIKAMAALLAPCTTVVVNGKVVSDIDLSRVVAHHRRHRSVATLVVVQHAHADAWGAVRIDERGRVVRIAEIEGPSVGTIGPGHLFTGIHVIEPELVQVIPQGPCCVIRTAYAELLACGAPIHAFVHSGYFYEHSTPQRYLQGNLNLLDGRVDPPGRPGPLRGVSPEAVIHKGARLVDPVLVASGAVVRDGAVVGPRVALGEGATVAPGVTLTDAVVWARAVVSSSAARAIITPTGRVPVSPTVDPMAFPR